MAQPTGNGLRQVIGWLMIMTGVVLGISAFLIYRNHYAPYESGHKGSPKPYEVLQYEYEFSTQEQPSPVLNLSIEDKAALIEVAKSVVSGSEAVAVSLSEELESAGNLVVVALRKDHELLDFAYSQADGLVGSVREATSKAVESIEKSDYDLEDSQIAIYILGEARPYSSAIFLAGIHSLRVSDGDKTAVLPSSLATELNMNRTESLQYLCDKAGIENVGTLKKEMFETLHFATTRWSDKPVTFYRANTIEDAPDISRAKLEYCLDLAIGGLIQSINHKGIFAYEYNAVDEEYSTKNNMIRQLMPARVLAELSQSDKELKRRHQKNLDFVFRYWYKEKDDAGYIYFFQRSKLGANAMALRTLTYSPFFKKYRKQADRIANSILSVQNDDGSFEPYFIEPETWSVTKERLLYFYSGEAILALAEYSEKTGDDVYLEAAKRAQDFYIGEYVERIEETYYPALVPWHTMSMHRLYNITKDEKYLDAIFVLNDRLVTMQNTSGEPTIDLLGRFYSPKTPQYGTPHSSSDAVYTEGLAYAFDAAKQAGDAERADKYRRSIIFGIHNLINLQFRGSNMYYVSYPQRAEGCVRVRVGENRLRSDTTQHTVDAWMAALKFFDDDDFDLELGEAADA